MITATGIRSDAREHLKGKWGKGVLITLCYLLFEYLISFILSLAENITVLGFIMNIAQIVISIPISYGLIVTFIKLKRDEEVHAFDFLSLGFKYFSRAWKVTFSTIVKLIVPIILCVISFVVLYVSLISYGISYLNGITLNAIEKNSSQYQSSIQYDTKSYDITTQDNAASGYLGLVVVGVIAVFASGIYYTIKSLLYTLSEFIAYDEPELTSKEAVEKSKALMKGNRGNYFVLQLSFIGWALLASFTLGIGFLWLAPYILVSSVCFYETVKENSENK